MGVRAYILAAAGTSLTSYQNAAEVFAAACGAREARVSASPRWSQLITIDIIRRDALSPRLVVSSVLVDMPEPARDGVPVLEPEPRTWPELSPDGH